MCDLTGMLVKKDEKYYEKNIVSYKILNPAATKMVEGEIYSAMEDYIREKDVRYGEHYINSDQTLSSIMVFGDSMLMEWGPLIR